MTDGYYLFTYLEIDPLGSVYGLSQRHDLMFHYGRKTEKLSA